MRALVQRVSRAAVRVDDRLVAEIGPGLLVLLGSPARTTPPHAERLAEKVRALRVFADSDGHMNEALGEREILCVSQFTLYGDTRRGNRPSFVAAAPAEQAEPLYQRFCDARGRATRDLRRAHARRAGQRRAGDAACSRRKWDSRAAPPIVTIVCCRGSQPSVPSCDRAARGRDRARQPSAYQLGERNLESRSATRLRSPRELDPADHERRGRLHANQDLFFGAVAIGYGLLEGMSPTACSTAAAGASG